MGALIVLAAIAVIAGRFREPDAATHAASRGLAVHAGHGLTLGNVGAVAAIPECEELNIGHALISRAVILGLDGAVREMLAAMAAARAKFRLSRLTELVR